MTDRIFAVVDGAGNIVNRIVADASFVAPDGFQLVQESDGVACDIGGTIVSGIYAPPPAPAAMPAPPARVIPQDLMAQFTAADAAKIQAAIAGNASFWLLWQSMTAQRDPMLVGNARFQTGWAALVQVLGADRMAAIASALGVTV